MECMCVYSDGYSDSGEQVQDVQQAGAGRSDSRHLIPAPPPTSTATHSRDPLTCDNTSALFKDFSHLHIGKIP